MSGKRRKISGESTDNSNISDPLNRFKEATMMLIPCKCWSELWTGKYPWSYLRNFDKLDRTKHSKEEIEDIKKDISEKKRHVEKEVREKIESWGEGIDKAKYQDQVGSMSAAERVNELSSYGQHEKWVLKELLETLLFTNLNKHLKKFRPKHKQMSKVHAINEIIALYFGETGDLEKRKEESGNISTILENDCLTQDFRFVSMNSRTIPVDILVHIFSFLKYNKWIVHDLGRVNKVFYITILSSFRTLKITPKYVYNYSLLVLRSVRTITFSSGYSRFRNSELKHIISHLNPNRIRTIVLKMLVSEYTKTLRYLSKINKQCRSILRNVRALIYLKPDRWMDNFRSTQETRAYSSDWKNISLSSTFPNLERYRRPLNFKILEGLELNRLRIDLRVPYEHQAKSLSTLPPPVFGFIGSQKRDDGINKSSVRDLSIYVKSKDTDRINRLLPFCKSFLNLQRLEIITKGRRRYNHGVEFKLQFTELISLRSLTHLKMWYWGGEENFYSRTRLLFPVHLSRLPSGFSCGTPSSSSKPSEYRIFWGKGRLFK